METLRAAAVARCQALALLFLLVLLPLGAVTSLAAEVREGEGFFFDRPILEYLHAHATPTRDTLMLFFSRVGAPIPMACFFVVVLGLLVWRRSRGDAAFFAVAVVGAMVLNFAAKILFGRARPDLWVSIAPEHDFSFPSGHAMGSMAVVAALVAIAWGTRWRWPVLGLGALFVALVGLSRLYLGVHYPSDVLTGWLASPAWVGGVGLIRSSAFLRARLHLREARREVAV